jgi:hypothetical protein
MIVILIAFVIDYTIFELRLKKPPKPAPAFFP